MATINAVDTTLALQTGTGRFVGGTAPTISAPIINVINDANAVPILGFTTIASAVNYLTVINEATGLQPRIVSVGSDTNIGMTLVTQGNGVLFVETTSTSGMAFLTGTAYQHGTSFSFANTLANRVVTFPDATGTVAFTGTLMTGNILKATDANTVADAGFALKANTTSAYAGGGTSNVFTATGLTSSSIVTAVILASTNAVSIAKAVPGSNNLTVTFSSDPGANTTVSWIAITPAV